MSVHGARDSIRRQSFLALATFATIAAVACSATPGPGGPAANGTDIEPSVDPTSQSAPTPGAATPAAAEPGPSEASATGEVPAGTLPTGRIVFDSDRSGNLDIWYLDGGGEAVQITTDPGSDRVASWEPMGDSVIFSSDRLGGPSIPSGGALRAYGLFIARLDGSEDRHLLGTQTFNSGAHYSPDGSQIVFSSDATETTQIYLVEPDYEPYTGSEPVPLTSDGHNDGPAWSHDGALIAFRSLRDGNGEIYVMNADGSNQQRLTDDPADDGSPAWSPDRSQIAFQSERAGGRHIFVMDADGGNVRQLTQGDVRDGFPTWSPDGEWIAFDRAVTRDDIEILVMSADGSQLMNVTNDPARDAFPSWGP